MEAAAVLMLGLMVDPASAHRSDKDTPPKCNNKIERVLHEAGFRGRDKREAWSIVMRESRGQNLVPGHWGFNGSDWGIWQVNAPSHSSASWFSFDAMSDPVAQSKIVYRWSKGGKYWTPWGLTPDGELDATHYGGWSEWQRQNWIIGPFKHFFKQYPQATRGSCKVQEPPVS